MDWQNCLICYVAKYCFSTYCYVFCTEHCVTGTVPYQAHCTHKNIPPWIKQSMGACSMPASSNYFACQPQMRHLRTGLKSWKWANQSCSLPQICYSASLEDPLWCKNTGLPSPWPKWSSLIDWPVWCGSVQTSLLLPAIVGPFRSEWWAVLLWLSAGAVQWVAV